jgi:hypothetical protein
MILFRAVRSRLHTATEPGLREYYWAAVTNVPSIVSNRNQVIVAPVPGSRFYRLVCPLG